MTTYPYSATRWNRRQATISRSCRDEHLAALFLLVDEAAGDNVVAMCLDRITVDPDCMGGLPSVRDLRVTMSMVLGQLAAGRTRDEVLGDYPYLEPDDINAVLEYGAARVNERDPPLA